MSTSHYSLTAIVSLPRCVVCTLQIIPQDAFASLCDYFITVNKFQLSLTSVPTNNYLLVQKKLIRVATIRSKCYANYDEHRHLKSSCHSFTKLFYCVFININLVASTITIVIAERYGELM